MRKFFFVFLIMNVLSCMKQQPPQMNNDSTPSTLPEATALTNEAFRDQVPEEDIELLRQIQREIGGSFIIEERPITRGSGVNPTDAQIISAMKNAGSKYSIPYEILYAVGKAESNLRQFNASGDPLISGDNGIGIMQVTPGRVDISFNLNSLKYDYIYNIEAGAQVILSKWKYVKGRNPIGDMNWKALENWYFALWAYNGYSNINNPNQYLNGPRKWCNSSICWTVDKPYQEKVLVHLNNKFAINVTRIPGSQLPASGIPASGKAFATPAPIHYTGTGGGTTPYTGPGSHSDPYAVTAFPFSKSSTTVGKESKFNTYPPFTPNESGPEEVYKLTIPSAGTLTVSVSVGSGVDVDVHLLTSLANSNCLIRDDKTITYNVNPGTYYVIADTYSGASKAGAYTISMSFQAAPPVAGSHANPYAVTAFPYSKSSTTVGKESKFNTYPPFTPNESGPEEVYKLTIPSAGTLTVSVSVGSGVDVDVHLLTSLANSNCLIRDDKTITYNVNPGTYYVIADTYSGASKAGAYTISMTFQAAAVNNAQFVSQSVPATLIMGQNFNASVTMKNTGTTTWTAGQNYRLGSQNAQDNTVWGTNRVYLPSGVSVAPGQNYTFSFTLKAPANPGTYNFQWKMFRESVAWFGGATNNTAIQVQTGRTRLYRLWSASATNHFYTTSLAERNNAIANLGYAAEDQDNIYIHAQAGDGRVPLYRYYSASLTDHFYTTLGGGVSTMAPSYNLEGIAGYVYTASGGGRVRLYRYYSSTNKDSFYTTLGGGAATISTHYALRDEQIWVYNN